MAKSFHALACLITALVFVGEPVIPEVRAEDPPAGSREGKRLEGYGRLAFGMTFTEARKLLGSQATDVGKCDLQSMKLRCLEFVELKETTRFVVTAAFDDKQMRLVRIVVAPLVGPDHFASDECWRIMEQMAIRYTLEFGMPDGGFPIQRSEMGSTDSKPGDPNNLLVADSIFTFPKGGTITISGVDTPAKNECSVLVWYERSGPN